MVEELVPLGEPEKVTRDGKSGFRAGYRAIVRVTVNQLDADLRPIHVTFSDVGYGDSIDYSGSYITVQELASKEAVSDAVKRALKNFGSQFGLDLYDKEARADIEKRAKLAQASVASLKKAVWEIAVAELGEKPTVPKAAKLFKVDAADLQERETLLAILRDRGRV